jgi:cytochrome P450
MSNIAIQLAYDLFNEAFALTSIIFGSKFPKTNIFPRHKRINSDIAGVRSVCKKMIEETEKSGKKESNLLTHLLDLRKTGSEDNGLTDEQIVGEFVGLFGAGTDTTANLVTCAVYFLTQRPEILKKVKEEVDRELADMKTITIENLNRMDYTTAFLKEVLRLNVGCLFYRKAMQDDNLAGVDIKKGTVLTVLVNVNHTDEKYYSNPEEVIPERWLAGTTQNQDGFRKEPFSYIPFSAGPRTCIGQHFAMVEAKVLLGLLVKTFDFKIPESYKFQLVQGVVFEPLDPLRVSLLLSKKEN